jgi:hypothetical protein
MTQKDAIISAPITSPLTPMPTPSPVSAAASDPVPVLLGRVYAEAQLPLKSRLLEHLLKPLGLLSLAAVCNGAFASLALNPNWSGPRVRPELALAVDAEQVTALAGYVQQVSYQAINGLSQVLTASPVLQGSVAASTLVALLIQRARAQAKPDQRDFDVFAG